MKLSLWFLLLLAVGATENARAQAVELFGGYSYLRGNTSFTGEQINLHGASFSAAYHVNHWLGIVGDGGFYHAGNIADQFTLTLSSYQAGPRVMLRNRTHFAPYGQFLIGGGVAKDCQIRTGAIFRVVHWSGGVSKEVISGETVARVVKKYAALIGKDAKQFGGHSLPPKNICDARPELETVAKVVQR